MVALFASLKFRILANRAGAANGIARYGWLGGLILSVGIGLLVALPLSQLRHYPILAPQVMATVYTTVLLAWLVMPMVAFGVDETLDPRRFALLPLRRNVLQRGLLVAALIGYLPLANVLALGGSAVGLSSSWALLPVAAVCALALLLMCVIFARALAASLASLMATRRGRDLGMLVSFGIFVIYFLLSIPLNSNSGPQISGGTFGKLATALGFTPPGALALIPADIASGNWGLLVLRSALVVAAFAGGWWWWHTALSRTMTTFGSTTQSSATAGGLVAGAAVASNTWQMARLTFGRILTMSWRDPMRRLTWLMILALSIGWPFAVAQGSVATYAGYFCVLGALMCGTQTGVVYAIEGSGLWLHMVAFADTARARGELWGNALVTVIGGGGLTTVAILVHIAVQANWSALLPTLGVCLGALFGSTALAIIVSAYLPYAVPQSRKSLFASKVPGQGGRTAVASLVIMLGGLVPALPAVLAAWTYHRQGGIWGSMALIAGVAVGAIAVVFAIRLAADRYLARSPEILQVVCAGHRV